MTGQDAAEVSDKISGWSAANLLDVIASAKDGVCPCCRQEVELQEVRLFGKVVPGALCPECYYLAALAYDESPYREDLVDLVMGKK